MTSDSDEVVQQRHQTPTSLDRDRELVLACPEMRSNVNLSRLVRLAGCAGVRRMIVAGRSKVDRVIARDAVDFVDVQPHRSLAPVLKRLRTEDWRLVGLEQTNHSVNLADYAFRRRTVLVLGHERHGIEPPILELLDETLEIPVWGMPASYNVVTAAAMAIYEYCRQFPSG